MATGNERRICPAHGPTAPSGSCAGCNRDEELFDVIMWGVAVLAILVVLMFFTLVALSTRTDNSAPEITEVVACFTGS